MSSIIAEAVKTLSSSVNVSTGLAHPNDMNRAKESFKVLHAKGEVILKSDVESAALAHGWSESSADELAAWPSRSVKGRSRGSTAVRGGPAISTSKVQPVRRKTTGA